MCKYFFLTLLILTGLACYSQNSFNKDSAFKIMHSSYKKIKRFKHLGDSSSIIIEYNKNTLEVIGTRLFEWKYRRMTDYAFHKSGLLFMRVTDQEAGGKHMPYAEYFFKNGVMIYKNENKYVIKDYSVLSQYADSLRGVAQVELKKKFAVTQ